jgi:hypothetical protein
MMIDSDRRERIEGMMQSLTMGLNHSKAFDYSEADFTRWCLDAGFSHTEFIHLDDATYAGIAYK